MRQASEHNDNAERYGLLQNVMDNFSRLAYDSFGHYVIEELFQFYSHYELESLLSYMNMYIVFFAQDQYSSSIVRKTIEVYGEYVCVAYIDALVSEGVYELMETDCGSFTLHRLIETT